MVREQLFAYILDTYHENDLTFDSYEKRKLASGLAYDGKWKPYFEYIAGCLHRYASQRDKQKGEYFVHGFTLAMTAQNPFYRPVSEGGNLAASKIRNLECPSYEICLIDYGCGKFNRKIHIMEQYP